ncbi:MAG: transposase, partial [Methanosarcina mazei]
VRVVSDFIDQIDISLVINSYPGGGSSSYHLRMLLKVIVYAYVEKIYSGRQIAKALRENVNFMWLAGGSKADFRTINRFRSERMVGNIKSVFSSMIEYLIDSGYISFEKYFLDGTTIEANARRSSYVWKKNTNRHKNNLEETVRELFEEIERITEAENAEHGDEDLEELGKNAVVKPSYNVQIGTEDQFILGYSIHNNPADSRVMGNHLEQVKDMMGKMPEILIAEVGYGCEENYCILEDEDIQAVVK